MRARSAYYNATFSQMAEHMAWQLASPYGKCLASDSIVWCLVGSYHTMDGEPVYSVREQHLLQEKWATYRPVLFGWWRRRQRQRRRRQRQRASELCMQRQRLQEDRSLRQATAFSMMALTDSPRHMPSKRRVRHQLRYLINVGLFGPGRVGQGRFRVIHHLTGTKGGHETTASHLRYLHRSKTGIYSFTPSRMGSAIVALRVGALARSVAIAGRHWDPDDRIVCAMLDVICRLITVHTALKAFGR